MENYIIRCAEWSVNNTKSSTAVANTFLQKIGQKHSTKLSEPRLFGLDIEPLYNFRNFNIDKEINNQSSIDDDVNEYTGDILVDDHEVGNGAFRSLLTLLKALIPIWKAGENPVIIPGNTLYIKLGGDGRNVGRKQNHVMITFCLLNEGKEVLKPDHQYCICLYVGREKYEDLAKVGQLFQNQLFDLKNNGIIDQDGIHWPTELFFCGDWKFMYIIMGQSAPNSKYFCLYCDCEATSRWDMNRTWNNTVNTKYVLMECLFADLIKNKDFSKQIKSAIELAFKNIKVHFEFFQSKSTGKQWNWTSLMGPDKKIMLEKFPVSQFIPGTCEEDIEKLWQEFYHLYMILHKAHLSDQEIDQFEIDAQNWICIFCHPTQGCINSPIQIPGLYRKEDVTPHMHVFAKHVPQFLRQLKEKGLSLQILSTSSTTMGGGTDGKSVVYNIMSFENHQLFYLINNTPKKIVARNIDVNKEN
ncbi:hypothetical protein RhiirA1_458950 [Rhizophagus irregularis]|uniref:Uncharacterized protein n=1 Tax=Rhizophagus irregularis TaxID=588596 RepID=A0A2N0RUL8_9GLOM|nr:hypothetical protein RhiirA1_458950 [Rhizophagus irregularis]